MHTLRNILCTLLLGGTMIAPVHAGIVSNEDILTVNVFSDDVPDADTDTSACDIDPVAPGNQCTLRAAVQQANTNPGHQTIVIALDQTIVLDLAGPGGAAAGDLDITETVRITGLGAAGLMPEDSDRLPVIEAAAGFNDRLFRVVAGAGNVVIEGLHLRRGTAVLGAVIGGAISNAATLTVRHSRFEHNAALRGGAIDTVTGATLLVEDSDFAFNSADQGSAIAALGDTTIRRSSFRDQRDRDGAYPRHAIRSVGASLVIENATISGASQAPGSTPNAGILVDNPTLFHLRNSTLVDFPVVNTGDVAVRLENVGAGAEVRIANAILAREDSDMPVCQSPGADASHDAVIDHSVLSSTENECEAYFGDGADVEVTPELGTFQQSLARVTRHRAPTIGSALIDAGRPEGVVADAALACTTTDQNQTPRPLDGDVDGEARCDLGAVEVESGLFIVNSSPDEDDAVPGDGVCETAFGNGQCSLRAAVMEANAHAGADLIRFLPDIGNFLGLDQAASAGAEGGDLDISEAVTIEGNLNPGGLPPTSIDQERAGERLFEIDVPDGHRVLFRGLHLHGGTAAGLSGGAMRIAQGDSVVVDQSVFSENTADSVGGAISVVDGYLLLSGSDVHHNESNGAGAALFLDDGAGARISRSSFWRNAMPGLERSTIFASPGATLFVENSTVAFNDGGVVAESPDFMRVDQSTLAGNADQGLSVQFGGGFDRLVLVGSIISNNGLDDCAIVDPEQANTLLLDGFNLDTDGSCAGGLPSNITADPDLDVAPASDLPLQRPAGQLTRIAPPRPSSDNPALDAISGGGPQCQDVDQLGTQRPQQLLAQPDGAGTCDIGAVELLGTVIFGDGLEDPPLTSTTKRFRP